MDLPIYFSPYTQPHRLSYKPIIRRKPLLNCCFLLNMKQKIVIKVQMSSEKCRTKAMKIAVAADGVSSVAIQGSENDQLVVSGEGVDPANLTRSLRKKLCPATLLTVEEVKEKEGEKLEKKPEVHSFSYLPQVPVYYQLNQPNPYYDPYPADNCSIM